MMVDHARPDWQSLKEKWPNAPHSRFVNAGSLRWHIQEMGELNNSKILLLHGTGASTHSFGDMLPLLAEKYHIIALDLPGHGFTSEAGSSGLSLAGMSRSINMLLNALSFAPDYVVGHSAGAAIGIWMTLEKQIEPDAIFGLNAALQPIKGNAILSPMAKLLFVNPLTTRLVSFQAKHLDLAPKLLNATGTKLPRDKVRYYETLVKCRSHIDGALGMMANWNLEPLQQKLPVLQTPLFLIAAHDDAMVPSSVSRDAAKRAPQAQFVERLEGGHLMHETDPAAFIAIIDAHIPHDVTP